MNVPPPPFLRGGILVFTFGVTLFSMGILGIGTATRLWALAALLAVGSLLIMIGVVFIQCQEKKHSSPDSQPAPPSQP